MSTTCTWRRRISGAASAAACSKPSRTRRARPGARSSRSRCRSITSPPWRSTAASDSRMAGTSRRRAGCSSARRGYSPVDVTRRDFLTLIAVAGGLGALTPRALAQQLEPERLLDFQDLGNVTLLHMTDAHATLNPVYYREPDTLIGVGDEAGKPPFLTGEALLRAYGIPRGTAEAYALSHLDFEALAARYGRMGGYAHLATLVTVSYTHLRAHETPEHLVCRL